MNMCESSLVTCEIVHTFEDVIDMICQPGELVGFNQSGAEIVPHELFGCSTKAWCYEQAARRIILDRWDGRCEKCGHNLRWAHLTLDNLGEYHCFGRECMNLITLGKQETRRLLYSEKIAEKETGFCASFKVPQKFWDMDRADRPSFARAWKTVDRRSRDRQSIWFLSIWGDTFSQCLDHCLEADSLFGKLC